MAEGREASELTKLKDFATRKCQNSALEVALRSFRENFKDFDLREHAPCCSMSTSLKSQPSPLPLRRRIYSLCRGSFQSLCDLRSRKKNCCCVELSNGIVISTVRLLTSHVPNAFESPPSRAKAQGLLFEGFCSPLPYWLYSKTSLIPTRPVPSRTGSHERDHSLRSSQSFAGRAEETE